ncbi:cobalamin biosynthesis protein P47K [Clostridium carboxidivorans P7]|uniref:Cobalamin synthesis protein P47K n=1 Tax=Clostridium carboxidivorans P7 TaxID=536227 RepID=C6PU19_9CLOT|nr:GTP-binding protein [Clostridium carboxidivorans]AKN33861.1 cobalamin biosynthesis protein P47K [Clostridium carboxidivorans P7]EET87219.1 cobalamin synthesis protein P47K [Clostridium carboxidivorans P7]EFG86524.1 CobW/P47K family protein [Clostridium carboxidivorans P7]
MIINVNIISGFLGAGKTTFLKKILPNMKGKIALIENEFGDIGIDGDLINDKLPIKEIYAGCICCSLVKNFKDSIEELALEYKPEHIFIEPSGVGNLSDIIRVCDKISENSNSNIRINHLITIVDVSAFDDYLENFGGFYLDQIRNANIIFLSHIDSIDDEKVEEVISKIKLNNEKAYILKDDWYSYEGEKIIEILDTIEDFQIDLKEEVVSTPADKVFSTLSIDNPKIFLEKDIDKILASLKSKEYGYILRAKGILELDTKQLVYFDFTPHHFSWEYIKEVKETKVAFIGNQLKKQKILQCFTNRHVSKVLSRYPKF